MAWGAVAGAAVSVIGSSMTQGSAGEASAAQDQGTAAAVDESRRQYNQTRNDLAPWRENGSDAINRLSVLLGLKKNATPGPGAPRRDTYTMTGENSPLTGHFMQAEYDAANEAYRASPEGMAAPADEGYGDLTKKFTLADFWDDPVTKASYQQGLDVGTNALMNQAGASGSRNSGGTLKALTRFSTDYTGGQAAGSQARFVGDQNNLFNRLSGVAGSGQVATTNTAQMGQNSANTIGGLLSAQGNARGAAAIAGGNALSGGIQNAGNTIGNLLNRQQNQNGNYNSSGSFQPFYDMNSNNYG